MLKLGKVKQFTCVLVVPVHWDLRSFSLMQGGFTSAILKYLDLEGERKWEAKEAEKDDVVSICLYKLTVASSIIKFLSLDVWSNMLIITFQCKLLIFLFTDIPGETNF